MCFNWCCGVLPRHNERKRYNRRISHITKGFIMRFIHITDTHVGPTATYGLPGKPALPTLEALVDTINNLPFKPDFVLHNGDVTDDASEAAYRLVKPILAKLKYPIYYVIGN